MVPLLFLTLLFLTVPAGDAIAQVGRRVVADFNGDGRDDLAIGAPGANLGRGAITIYVNREGFGPFEVKFYVGGIQGDNYGTALAAADFNRDGFFSLVVGAPYWSNGRGRVQILDFGPSGIRSVYEITQDSPGVQGAAHVDDLFGAAVATGDFDGDGYPDLAIGAPGEDLGESADAGLVHVLFGTSAGPNADRDQIWHRGRLGLINKVQANEQFGYTLAAGDFNQDAITDLAVGVPFAGSTVGEVNVIYGGSGGLGGPGALPPIRVTHLNGLFGLALATGDINNDGYDDLVGGSPRSGFVRPGFVRDAGTVKITFGSAAGLKGGQQLDQSLVFGSTPETGDQFGNSLAVADFNGDGFADIAVGVPGETTDTSIRQAGLVNIFYGGPTGAQSAGAHGFDQDSPDVAGMAETRDFFGQTVMAGDFNGDGFADLAVAAPYEDLDGVVDAGAVIVFFGTLGGISASNNQLVKPWRIYPGALFGYAIGH